MHLLVNLKNGIRVSSEEFSSLEEAQRAQKDCQNVVDAAIMDLEALNDTGVEHAIRELAAETFEIREMEMA